MLIVAIPKSASSSLLETLGKLHKLPTKQDNSLVRNLPISNEFEFIHKYHGCMREIDVKFVNRWTGNDGFFKNHVLPTKNNLELLKGKKKVVLLRSVEDVILAYMRERDKFNDKYRRKEFKACKSEIQWLNMAKEIGLFSDLVKFNEFWKSDNSDKLIIQYHSLIKNPQNVINDVEEYFGLTKSKNVKLSRKRYTR